MFLKFYGYTAGAIQRANKILVTLTFIKVKCFRIIDFGLSLNLLVDVQQTCITVSLEQVIEVRIFSYDL